MNLHNKSARFITKSCIVVHVQLSEDPGSLKLRAGNGKFFSLKLMQGLKPAIEIPKEIDVQPGDIVAKPFWLVYVVKHCRIKQEIEYYC